MDFFEDEELLTIGDSLADGDWRADESLSSAVVLTLTLPAEPAGDGLPPPPLIIFLFLVEIVFDEVLTECFLELKWLEAGDFL